MSHIFSMSLLPTGTRSYPIGVEWTLVYEISFYCLMTLFIFIPSKIRIWGLVIWLTLIITSAILYPSWSSVFIPNLSQVYLSSFCVPFIFGCFVSFIHSKRPSGNFVPCMFSGVAFILAGGYVPKTEAKQALLGIGFSLITLSMLWTPLPINKSLTKILSSLGDWSYGIYLAHVPAITIILAIIPSDTPSQDFFAVCLFAFCISSLFGMFEHKVHNKLKFLITKH